MIQCVIDFNRIEKSTELAYLEVHPEIPKRPHQTPEFRMFLATMLEQHNAVELEHIKEEEETPVWLKERRRIEEKIQ